MKMGPACDNTENYMVPSKLYGYEGEIAGAFTQLQLLARAMIHPQELDFLAAAPQGFRFPFLAIEA